MSFPLGRLMQLGNAMTKTKGEMEPRSSWGRTLHSREVAGAHADLIGNKK